MREGLIFGETAGASKNRKLADRSSPIVLFIQVCVDALSTGTITLMRMHG